VAGASSRGKKKRRKVVDVLLSIVIVALLAAAGVLVWKSMQPPEEVNAPLPSEEFSITPGDVVGATGKEPVDVGDGDTMTVPDMAPNSVFIPAIGAYLPVLVESQFVESKYAGFQSIKIPNDPWTGVTYAGGGPMYGGQEGTTTVASHVSTANGWGALRYLYTLTGGEVIYTKDGDGNLQSWQVSSMSVRDHTDFPQEYWAADGVRRLIVTTCGGTVGSDGLFGQNIFAEAVPLDPKPKTQTQLELEQTAAAVGEYVTGAFASGDIADGSVG
jgi:hypothetical protein